MSPGPRLPGPGLRDPGDPVPEASPCLYVVMAFPGNPIQRKNLHPVDKKNEVSQTNPKIYKMSSFRSQLDFKTRVKINFQIVLNVLSGIY